MLEELIRLLGSSDDEPAEEENPAVTRPTPNGGPVPTPDGGTVEHQVCTCCQPTAKIPEPKTKSRFFVRDAEGKLVCMALDWEKLCQTRGWV